MSEDKVSVYRCVNGEMLSLYVLHTHTLEFAALSTDNVQSAVCYITVGNFMSVCYKRCHIISHVYSATEQSNLDLVSQPLPLHLFILPITDLSQPGSSVSKVHLTQQVSEYCDMSQ